ncbi:hypothetical protein FBY33_0123 [Arthrobacter sp. SLBN-112]|uniref:hypothetical protein n=1 Tax=Arthrobacter sp. SLBN-112 TaxID=2768452 RepID=UPI001153F0E9|nr:hypothetical protein [Arthrobacter sp. SLBN-112]TQJ38131.1 hypothetical protein FBY33_0123 [Arthrobacter sp. SLBN-112]
MTAPVRTSAITFLRRAGLFGAVLALIAGIFGMHVMTTTHALHSPSMAAAAGSAHHEAPVGGHTGGHLPVSLAPDLPGFQTVSGPDASHCPDSGNCTSMQAMSASCTPSAKSGSLAAPLPGTWVAARSTNTASPTDTSAGWSYLPGSPSPGELCISRT